MFRHNVNFCQAPSLKTINSKNLFETYYYNLKNEHDKLWFLPIADNFDITKIEEVNNPHLYGLYLLWKEELLSTSSYGASPVQELILYHSTSSDNARSIARDNIDWRKTKRSKYGKGACFTQDPLYASYHSSAYGAFVVFRVLVKNREYIPGIRYGLRVPSETTYDTTVGNMGKVFVKYDDFQFYPEYIVYHK